MKKEKKPVSNRKQSRVKGERQMQEKLKFWLALSDSKPVLQVKPDDQVDVDRFMTVDSNDRKLDRKTVAVKTNVDGDYDRKFKTRSVNPPANVDVDFDDSLNLTVEKPDLDIDSYQLKKPEPNIFVDGQVDEVAGGPGGQPVRCDGVWDEEALQQESYRISDVLTLPNILKLNFLTKSFR